jgi:hypothetical protein
MGYYVWLKLEHPSSVTDSISDAQPPNLWTQTKDCLDRSDYSCLVELSYRNPPKKKKQYQKLVSAKSLAFLGKTDEALEHYQNEPNSNRRHEIISAIILFHLAQNNVPAINATLNAIPQIEEQIRALNQAQSNLFAFNYHPDFAQKMQDIIAERLKASFLDHSDKVSPNIDIPYSLAETHLQDLQALAVKINDAKQRSHFLAELQKYHQRAKRDRQDERKITNLLHTGNVSELSNLIARKVEKAGDLEQKAYALFSYISGISFFRFSPENDLQLLDLLVEAIILASIEFDEDHACKSQIYSTLAGLYAKTGRNDHALKLLDQFRASDPIGYHDQISKTACAMGGFFLNATTRALLGDTMELEQAGPAFVSQHTKKATHTNTSRWRLGTGLGFRLHGTYASDHDRSKVFSLILEQLDTHFPITSSENIHANFIDNTYRSNLMEKTLGSPDLAKTMELGRSIFSILPTDMPDSFFRDKFLPRLVANNYHRGFIHKMYANIVTSSTTRSN